MGIRTGQQYLDKLNAMTPHIVIDGEVVSEKVAEHPAFRNVARSYAKLFDMQHDQQYQEALTYASPGYGRPGQRVLPGARGPSRTCSAGAGRSPLGLRPPTDSWAARATT